MKKLQTWMIAAAALLCMGGLTACGNNRNNKATENVTERATERNTAGNRETVTENTTDNNRNNVGHDGVAGETDANGNRITQTTETDRNGNLVNNATDNAGGVVGDVAEDVGDAGKAVIDGAENVVDDITGNTERATDNNGVVNP